MTTTVSYTTQFSKALDRLARKHPQVINEVDHLITTLKNDERPGDQIPKVGYTVYKVRVKNPSANRGKSGGFRVIYYVQVVDHVVLLTIYSKTEQTDISPADIRDLLESLPPPNKEKSE